MNDATPQAGEGRGDHVTAKSRYEQLHTLREPYLRRARDCAKVTLPYLLPPDGHRSTADLYTPYQSLGARGVNNLAAKLLVTQFPPNSPFYRFVPTQAALDELQGQQAKLGQIEAALSKYEQAIQRHIESKGYRVTLGQAKLHLIVSGNVLLFVPKTDKARYFSLDQYVTKRDASGNVIEIITMEKVAPMALPAEVRALVPSKDGANPADDIELYTWVKRTESNWESCQYVEDVEIPDTKGTYPLDKSPYMALRWHALSGEDYGRGYVEDYLGDLMSLEGLSQAIVEGSAAAARVLIMVKPGAASTHRQITNANSGDVLTGDVDDVGILQLEKYADFRVAQMVIDDISKRLSFAFLLNTAVQRNGERVTAEEIRYMAQELETALGGTYSVLSQELQLPFLRRVMHVMEASNELPKLPKGFADPTIITGLEALGRGNDLSKLRGFIQMVGEMGDAGKMLLARVHIGELADRLAAAGGIDTAGLIKTEEEVQAEEQRQQMLMMAQTLGPNAVNAMGNVAKQSVANQAGANGAPADGPQPPPA